MNYKYVVIITTLTLLGALIIAPVTAIKPVAAFFCTPTNGTSPLPVVCTDSSTGTPTGWSWYFGDEKYTLPWENITTDSNIQNRAYHAQATLSNGHIVVVGGYNNPIYKNDTIISLDDGRTWNTQNTSSGWSGRRGMTLNALSDDTLVLIGGYDGSTYLNDVWTSTDEGVTWINQLSSFGGLPRSFHSAIALNNDHIVIFGGLNSTDYFGDTWILSSPSTIASRLSSSSGWHKRITSGTRLNDGSVMLAFGFYSNASSFYFGDVWKLDNETSEWSLISDSSGVVPRRYNSLVTTPDNAIFAIGGSNGTYLNNTIVSINSGVSWSTSNLSDGRLGIASAPASITKYGGILRTGGILQSGNYVNSTYVLNTSSSSDQNPGHTYLVGRDSNYGVYPITLLTYNADGFDSHTNDGVFVPPYNVSAYGDSITGAFGYDGLNATGYDCYILNMSRRFGLGAADHNMDGSGWNTTTGLLNLDARLQTNASRDFYIALWTNDRNINASYPANQTADNIANMYLIVESHQMIPHVLLNPTTVDNAIDKYSLESQRSNISLIQTRLITYWGITPILSFDATDLIPYNRVLDGNNATTQDGAHPNVLGHSLIADYIYWRLQGGDYVTAQFTPAGPLTIWMPPCVTFRDASTGSAATAWNWSFGDGTYSEGKNPTHCWQDGTYTVALNVTDGYLYSVNSTTVKVY